MSYILSIGGMEFALSHQEETLYKTLTTEILDCKKIITNERSLELLNNFFIDYGFSKNVLKHKYNENDIRYATSVFKLIDLYKTILKKKSLQYTGNTNTFLSKKYCDLNSLYNINNIIYTIDDDSIGDSNYFQLSGIEKMKELSKFNYDRYQRLKGSNVPTIKKVDNATEVENNNLFNNQFLLQYKRNNYIPNTSNSETSERAEIKKSFWDSEYGKKLDTYIQNLKNFDPKTVSYTVLGTFLAGLGLYGAVKLWKKYKRKYK